MLATDWDTDGTRTLLELIETRGRVLFKGQ